MPRSFHHHRRFRISGPTPNGGVYLAPDVVARLCSLIEYVFEPGTNAHERNVSAAKVLGSSNWPGSRPIRPPATSSTATSTSSRSEPMATADLIETFTTMYLR